MIGHQSFPVVDDRKINGKFVPSTISKKVVTDLLKGELGFDGVVLTDGIRMVGLYSLMPYEELVVELVNAGNDVLLGCEVYSGDLIEAASFYHAFNHGKEKSIGVSFGYPYIHYDTMENADVFINAYNPRPETMEAFVSAILGEIPIVGNSPVLLEPRVSTK